MTSLDGARGPGVAREHGEAIRTVTKGTIRV
jgi:hypothetical protein